MEIDAEDRISAPEPSESLDQEAVLLVAGASSNYWHWLLESVARIGVIRLAGLDADKLKFVVPAALSPMHLETLALAGVYEGQLVPWSGRPSQWKELIVPSRGLLSTNVLATPAVDYLRSLGSSVSRGMRNAGSKRIFICRSMATHRRVINESELLQIAQGYGFQAVFAENRSVADQVRLFQSAEMIVGPHGAGLTNCLFAPPGAAVLELFAERTPVRIYWHLAAAGAQHYAFCVGRGVEGSSTRGERWNDFVIRPDRFERVLNELIGASERATPGQWGQASRPSDAG